MIYMTEKDLYNLNVLIIIMDIEKTIKEIIKDKDSYMIIVNVSNMLANELETLLNYLKENNYNIEIERNANNEIELIIYNK